MTVPDRDAHDVSFPAHILRAMIASERREGTATTGGEDAATCAATAIRLYIGRF